MGALAVTAVVVLFLIVGAMQLALGPGVAAWVRRETIRQVGQAEVHRREAEARDQLVLALVVTVIVLGLAGLAGHLTHSLVAFWVFALAGLVMSWFIAFVHVFRRQIRHEMGRDKDSSGGWT